MDVLESGTDPVEAGRLRGWLVAVVVGGVAAALAAVVIAGRSGHDAGPPEPAPTLSMFTLAADPFLSDSDLRTNFPDGRFVRDTSAPARQLSPCLTDPRSWGAAQAAVATYRSRTDPTVTLNEYVLRFTDPDSAHRALLAAWAGLNSCRQPASDPVPRPSGLPAETFDESFVDKRAHRDHHDALYELFAVREGMVVVLLEDTAFPREEGGSPRYLLELTLSDAIAGFLPGVPPACVEKPQPCPSPSIFG